MSSKDFEFHKETGRLSLGFIATLGDRHGNPIERLGHPIDLARWFGEVYGQKIAHNPTEAVLAEANRLRASIAGLTDALYLGKLPVDHDIETINEFAATPPHPVRLATSGIKLEHNSLPTPSSLFGNIARDMMELVTGSDLSKMRLCAADDCSVYFIDHSRPGKRRWCSMSRCGNKEKKKRFVTRNR